MKIPMALLPNCDRSISEENYGITTTEIIFCGVLPALAAFIAKSNSDLPIPAILRPIPRLPVHGRLQSDTLIDDLDHFTSPHAETATGMPTAAFYKRDAEIPAYCLFRVPSGCAHAGKENM